MFIWMILQPSSDSDNDGIEDDCDVCPNSASNLDLNNDGICDSEACKSESITDFENGNGVWTDFGNYGSLNTNSTYAYVGTKSFSISC